MPTARTNPRLRTAVRNTVKWGGVVASLFLLTIGTISAWWSVTWQTDSGWSSSIHLGSSQFGWSANMNPTLGGLYVSRHSFQRLLWRFDHSGNQVGWTVIVPFWQLVLPTMAAALFAWLVDAKYLRRARAGLCAGCGYDRAGLAAGAVCPECGAAGGVVPHSGHAAAGESPVRS